MFDVVIFALLCTACYYLLARAEITRWFWQPLDEVRFIGPLLRCPACTGFYLGAVLGWYVHPVSMSMRWFAPVEFTVQCALLGMVCTAIGWGCMKWGLDRGAVASD